MKRKTKITADHVAEFIARQNDLLYPGTDYTRLKWSLDSAGGRLCALGPQLQWHIIELKKKPQIGE